MFEPNQERKADTEALLSFIDQTGDGTTVSWVEIEQLSGVQMNARGRELFRRAMRKRNREYFPLPGSGVRFSDPRNTIDIVRLRDSRITGAAKRSSKASSRLQTRHLEGLTPQDRTEFLMRQSLRGALLSGAKGLRQLEPKTPASPPPPQLPKR
jgi:hypothetical protein